ncbi:Os04g0143700 [Oryza sativa Japonica Group]|uniref:Os04g0143700 protein n=1 Tax=Oryza sativa subsp. japonica TaxID=39947 RepID=A0A0N7KIJ3_ORYSJ|nr:Os04g0143700 [Oryza sativa Japonica Group]
MPTINHPMKFKLRRYDSDVGLWKSMAVSVHEPAERGRLLPITHTPSEVLFHCTTKVITLGNAAVGWVDLWRGILHAVRRRARPTPCAPRPAAAQAGEKQPEILDQVRAGHCSLLHQVRRDGDPPW